MSESRFRAALAVTAAALAALAVARPVTAIDGVTATVPGCVCVCAEATTDSQAAVSSDNANSESPAVTSEVGTNEAIDDATSAVEAPPESAETSTATEPIEEAPAVEAELPAAIGELTLSELLPDPVGTDTVGEFIEISNAGQFETSLSGWFLLVGTKRYSLPSENLGAGGQRYFLYAETKLTLANAGSTVQLWRPDGTLASSVTYTGPAKEGKSWAHDGVGSWQWTTPTPGATNEFSEAEAQSSELPTIVEPVVVEPAVVMGATAVVVESAIVSPTAAIEAPSDLQFSTYNFQLQINELLPNPTGSDDAEFIEILNAGADSAPLLGWSIDDDAGGSRPFILGATAIVPAGGFLLLPKSLTGLGLNNDGDAVQLLRPDGGIADFVEYRQNAPDGKSWSRLFDGGWGWTAPTPGLPNTELASPSAATLGVGGPTVVASDGLATAEPIDWSDLAERDDGEEIILSGVVSLPPGIIGKTLFGLQDAGGVGSIITRIYGQGWPELTVGDGVVVSGKLTRQGGELRLAVPADGLSVLGVGEPPQPTPRNLPDLNLFDAALTVSVSGEVVSSGKGWLKIMDAAGESELKLVLPAEAPESVLAVGVTIAAVGVVRWRAGQPELVVLDMDELQLVAVVPDAAAGAVNPIIGAVKTSAHVVPRWVKFVPLCAVAACGAAWWLVVRRRQLTLLVEN